MRTHRLTCRIVATRWASTWGACKPPLSACCAEIGNSVSRRVQRDGFISGDELTDTDGLAICIQNAREDYDRVLKNCANHAGLVTSAGYRFCVLGSRAFYRRQVATDEGGQAPVNNVVVLTAADRAFDG